VKSNVGSVSDIDAARKDPLSRSLEFGLQLNVEEAKDSTRRPVAEASPGPPQPTGQGLIFNDEIQVSICARNNCKGVGEAEGGVHSEKPVSEFTGPDTDKPIVALETQEGSA
jgi:hypothetical protein